MHAAIKQLYAKKDSLVESKVDNFVIDVVWPNRLIEIQTHSFLNLKRKLAKLLTEHKITLVAPIARKKTIALYDESMKKLLHKRLSTKKGALVNVVDEIVYIPHLIRKPNLTLEVLLVDVTEIRSANNKGSWRRKGVSIIDTQLEQIVSKHTFKSKKDYAKLLPEGLPDLFTNHDLIHSFNIKQRTAYKLTNFLKKIDAIEVVEIKNRRQVFRLLI